MATSAFTPERLQVPVFRPDGSLTEVDIPIGRFLETLLQAPPVEAVPVLDVRRGHRRWKLIVPEEPSSGPSAGEIEAALEPLRLLRKGEPALRIPRAVALGGERAIRDWTAHPAQDLLEDECWLLLAGPVADLPFQLQQVLYVNHQVGRLSFADRTQYEAYAQRVCNASSRTSVKRRVLAFAPEFDDATRIGRWSVMEPILKPLRDLPGLALKELLSDMATADALRAALHDDSGAQTLWVATTHGVNPSNPKDPSLGALATHKGLLRASDLDAVDRPVVQDGLAVLFACNSGGVPAARTQATFPLPGFADASAGPQDHLAPLPSTLLAHPRGPLGVVAHIDLIFGPMLRNQQGEPPPFEALPAFSTFRRAVQRLASGKSIGSAFQPVRLLVRDRGDDLRRALASRCRSGKVNDPGDLQLVQDWIAWSDSRGWIAFGDPLVALCRDEEADTYRGGW